VTDKISYLKKMADQLQQWDTEIDELKTKAVKAKADSRTQLLNQIDELREKHVKIESARERLKLLQAGGSGSLDDVIASFEKSWMELRSALSKASARFK